ncbi:MAG: sulfur-carrier protein adenylyltransferase/sulfurtransferase [Thermoleophilaceae bacterium]|jgi:molybdopterin/thiamine biosynthesis adenylyltransferase|nr:sulfur-carrier protein adenylyltransferase/sulfurtransferase [Thermoleophilaceae bacterium]
MHPKLKDSVELFPAGDGSLYLLCAASGEDYLVEDPSAAERALLGALRDGGPWEELVADIVGASPGATAAQLDAALACLIELGVVEDAWDPPGDALSAAEADRYGRQLAYFGELLPYGSSRVAAQARLKHARVVVLGLGGLGSWAVWALASAGVGTIVGVDGDRVERSNLNRQILYGDADVGRGKADCAARAVASFNPHIAFVPIGRRLDGEAEVAEAIAGAGFVVEAADWPAHLIGRWVNRACMRAGVPHASASQFPPFVRIGPTVMPGRTACVECREAEARDQNPLFDELVAFRQSNDAVAATFGPACGLIGSLLAMEAVHHLAGVGPPATLGRAVLVDLRTLATTWEEAERHAECGCCAGFAQRL